MVSQSKSNFKPPKALSSEQMDVAETKFIQRIKSNSQKTVTDENSKEE